MGYEQRMDNGGDTSGLIPLRAHMDTLIAELGLLMDAEMESRSEERQKRIKELKRELSDSLKKALALRNMKY